MRVTSVKHGKVRLADGIGRTTRSQEELMGKQDVTAEYLEPRVGDVRHSLADITMARELLGYESKVDLREGLQRTIDWFRSGFIR